MANYICVFVFVFSELSISQKRLINHNEIRWTNVPVYWLGKNWRQFQFAWQNTIYHRKKELSFLYMYVSDLVYNLVQRCYSNFVHVSVCVWMKLREKKKSRQKLQTKKNCQFFIPRILQSFIWKQKRRNFSAAAKSQYAWISFFLRDLYLHKLVCV